MRGGPTGGRVAVVRVDTDLVASVRAAMDQGGILAKVAPGSRVSIKPNLTYPYYKPGVTTSPAVIEAVVRVLADSAAKMAIVETDGGYGAWKAIEAFEGHGLHSLSKRYGCEVVNLCEEPSEQIEFAARNRPRRLALPTRLLHETDVLVTLPVPKIHCMTGLSLSFKNQWGCVPDTMRLRRHHIFDEAIVAINQRLKPVVLGDGTVFLDGNGPMVGTAVPMGLVIGANDAGTFDRYVSELMRFPWRRVRHLRVAARLGAMPTELDHVWCNVPPRAVSDRAFHLERTLRNWIALVGFKSRFVTWLGYESWLGTAVVHPVLYAVAGKPVRPAPDAAAEHGR